MKPPENPPATHTLQLGRLIARLSSDSSDGFLDLKDHWVSVLFTAIYAIALIFLPSGDLIRYLGPVFLIFIVKAEIDARDSRKTRDIAAALEEIRLLLEKNPPPAADLPPPGTAGP